MQSNSVHPRIDESAAPNPPRYWWLKRFTAVGFVLVLSVVLLWLWWARQAQNRLRAAIDEVHSHGEPIELKDFSVAAIPDNENAAIYYINAHAALLHPSQIANQWLGWEGFQSSSSISAIGTLIDGESKALEIVRRARAHSASAWPINYQRPTLTTLLPNLMDQRTLTLALATATFIAHQRDQDELAVEYLRDMHHQADSMHEYAAFEIGMESIGGIDHLCSLTTLNLARVMRIADSTANAATRPGGASRGQIVDLIADLSDESQLRLGATHALWGERMIAVNPDTRWLTRPPAPLTKLLGPAIDLEAVRIVRYETEINRSISQANYPAAMAMLPPASEMIGHGSLTESITLIFSNPAPYSLQRLILIHFNDLCIRRGAVIALALQLYRHDHRGAWPDSLQQLVPTYLAAVPVDPFSPAGASFRYKPPVQSSGPVLYSIGQLADEIGARKATAHSPPYAGAQWIFNLLPPAAETQPSDSPQAADHHGDK